MAYDPNYYQPPQRPYDGRAAQRAGPPQGSSQPQAPQGQYVPRLYDQYQDDGHGYDDYGNGHAQDQGYGGGYQGHDGGYQGLAGGGRGNGYPPHNNNYPPQQEYYGNESGRGGGGMLPPRGGGRAGPGERPPMQRPPTGDGPRGAYDSRGGGQGRGYPNGGPAGRGGRPGPLNRRGNSDPTSRGQIQGQAMPRKPLKSPLMSPEQAAWDSPFPTFPGAKKKTSISEEQDILQKMAAMEVGGPPAQNRPRGPGSQGQGAYPLRGSSVDNSGRSSLDNQRRPPPDHYGRSSVESSRSGPGRGYPSQGPPQQGYSEPRRGPHGSSPGYGAPRQNGYGGPVGANGWGGEGYGPPSRGMNMPSEAPIPQGRQPPMGGLGQGAPYSGPVGRGAQRPGTANGNRPPPQRSYTTQPPTADPYTNNARHSDGNYDYRESVSDLYDAYYEEPRQGRPDSEASEMPNFDDAPVAPGLHRRGTSIDAHIQPPQQNTYNQMRPKESQPDFRHQVQPQSAIFEMAGDAPPMPDDYARDDGYGNGYHQGSRGYGGFDDPPQQNGFVPPPRSQSAAPGSGRGPPLGSLSNGPRPGFNGFAQEPGPNPQMGRTNAMPTQSSADSLPCHPVPVRPGLTANSVASQANHKPPPVRNYSNITTTQQLQQTPPPMDGASPAVNAVKPDDPSTVTSAELEQLRVTVKNNPADQTSAMLLARRLVDAADVLAPRIPDKRAQAKMRERYIMDAHKIIKKLIHQQNVEAMFYLADCYSRGALGLAPDNKEAFSLYQNAAKAGHPAAAYRTAVCCELGNDEGGGTRKDPLKAIQWYKRAALLGDTPAMYKMGMIQLKGLLGQPKNPREAVGWLKRAAERADAENPHALHELGLLYEAPQGGDSFIVRDEAYSFSLFSESADLGYKFSQFRLGAAYEYGLFGCPIDPRLSIMWYSKAAAQEEHQSELALSGWYLTGSEGVLQQSDTEAYLWARKAAMAGLAKAEYAMGYFTEVGIGSPANLEDAKRWYWRAAAQNFPKARERLEDLKRGGGKAGPTSRERISRSKVGKQNEGECAVM
ncbi:uncharacterized protein L3040_000001 [Drepanopeziza brunnea f. sp. 'multigermtubi']|uniref:uncharacterized protein n=1 Tax=Drepanopeziza brunnea f. sp. 'multigermtubi' TaxID=698441 RepID=UPI002382CD35|nr:hypothetical protein L3040_000001 [Drepanopeziza brunnea f. sp. 'multigermtubi']